MFIGVVLFCPGSWAQDGSHEATNRVPIVRVGVSFGRNGISQGFGGYVEVNPIHWAGFCAVISQSRTTHGVEGGDAQVSDMSMGGCITGHLPPIRQLLISPFMQLVNQREHNRINYPLDDGTVDHDGDDETHRVWTVGATIDRAIVPSGPRWMIRVGKNFGEGPAANNAAGIYFVAGIILPLDHPRTLSRSLRRIVGPKHTESR